MPIEGGFREKCGVVGVFGHPEAANLVYLGLSYAGGLWTTPADLPDAVAELSRALPTIVSSAIDGLRQFSTGAAASQHT